MMQLEKTKTYIKKNGPQFTSENVNINFNFNIKNATLLH